jgi:hypothetical protein
VQIFLLGSLFCSKLTRYFTSEFFLKSLKKFLIAGVLLNTLETKLTLAQDRIEEVDQAAEAMADFIDASTVTNDEYIQNAHTIMNQAKKKLYDTRNTLIAEMISAPNPTK